MRRGFAGLVAVAAILLVAIGAVKTGWFILGLGIFITVLVVSHFWDTIRSGIHSMLRAIPIEWQFGAWVVLTGIGTIGAVTYFLSGVTARYINASLYLVALIMAVQYMFRRVPETRWYKFWAGIWSFMIIPCIWKLIPFIGWVLAIVDIVLFWHFHYVADRSGQPAPGRRSRGDGGGRSFSSLNHITDYARRSSVEQISTGTIRWKFFPQDDSGLVASFTPLMWCHLPQFWRRIDFVKNGRIILVEERRWFHQPNRTNLGMVYDPDFSEGSGQWLISLICHNMEIRLIRGGKTKDGEHEQVLRFRIRSSEAELVLSCIDVLIQESCAFQGLKRLGRI